MVDANGNMSDEELKRLQMESNEHTGLLSGSWPEGTSKDSMLALVRDTIDIDHEEEPIRQAKMANFRDEEVGKPKSPVLAYENYAHYAMVEGHTNVALYLRGKVGGVAALSLGRKAKLLDSTFTSRREIKNLGTPRVTTEKHLFGPDKVIREGES